MKQRKLLALGMATLMAMSSTVMAFADESTSEPASGSASGNGTLEGFIDKDVFTVTLPTVSSLDFTIDPQELMLATSSSKKLDSSALSTGYGSKILFTSGSDFASKSPDITVVNKSTFGVDVKVDAKLTGLASTEDGYDIKVLDPDADDFDFGTTTAITMGLTPTANTLTGSTAGSPVTGTATYLNDTAEGISVTSTVAVSSSIDDAYEVKGSTGNYSYAIKSDVSSVAFNTVTFNLAGTVNTDADWTKFSEADSTALKVEITYSVSRHADVPTFTTGSSVGTISYTVGSGNDALASISSITLKNGSKAYDGYNANGSKWAKATDTAGTITFDTKFIAYYAANDTAEATVTYVTKGGATKTATVTVTTKDAD